MQKNKIKMNLSLGRHLQLPMCALTLVTQHPYNIGLDENVFRLHNTMYSEYILWKFSFKRKAVI